MLVRTPGSLLLFVALLASCGGDEFASAETGDASAGSAGASGAAGKAGAAGQAGSAGHGGSAGKAGAAPEGGLPEATVPDSAPEAAAGAAGAPADAGPDAPPLASCLFTGFSFTPAAPTSPAFRVHYKSAEPMVCIRFEVECANGNLGIISDTMVTDACDTGMHCWQADVSNCVGNLAKVRFFKDADNPADDTCHGMFPGSPGTSVAACEVPLLPLDG